MTKTIFIIADEKDSLESIAETIIHPYDGYTAQYNTKEEAEEKMALITPLSHSEKSKFVVRKVTVLVE